MDKDAADLSVSEELPKAEPSELHSVAEELPKAELSELHSVAEELPKAEPSELHSVAEELPKVEPSELHSVAEELPKAEPSELHDASPSDIAGEKPLLEPAITASPNEALSEAPAPDGAPSAVVAEEEPASTNQATSAEAAPREPSEGTPTPAEARSILPSLPSDVEPSEPPIHHKVPPPPWSSSMGSSKPSLPPPAAPWAASPSTGAVPLRARSSAPPVVASTNVRRERDKVSGIPSFSHRQDDTRKAIIIGCALSIIFGVLYLGRDTLMGTAPSSSMPPASTRAAASLKASARQEGVTVVLDGQPLGTLPLFLSDLSPGEHSLIFERGARYAAQKRTVNLTAGETKELEPVSLVVTTGVAAFDVKTPGVSLALVASDERRELADYSHPIEVDNGKPWLLEATKPGYKTLSLPLTFEDRAEKTFVIALDKANEPSPKVTSRAETAASTPAVSPDVARPTALKLPRSSQPSGSKAEAAASGNCTLNIDSNPPSHLTVDGYTVGATPKTGISVAAGTHSLMFASEHGKKATIVNCKSGEQKTLTVQLATH